VGWRPAKGLQPQARGRASPAPSAGQHVAAPDPFPGDGVRAPEAGRSGLACDGPATTRSGPGPPWRDRVREGPPKAPQPFLGTWRPRTCNSSGRVRGPRSQLSGPGYVPRPPEGEREITDCEAPSPGHPSRRYPYLYVPTPPPARMEPQTFGAYAPGTSLPSGSTPAAPYSQGYTQHAWLMEASAHGALFGVPF
jgi:hypothetical protein